MITGRKDIAAQVRELIQSTGYSVYEIVALIPRTGRRGRRSRAVTPGQGVYPRFVDPDNPNNVYRRGVLPGWMKERMLAHGLDPSRKADRETFKTTHLRKEMAAQRSGWGDLARAANSTGRMRSDSAQMGRHSPGRTMETLPPG
jgi:DNA-binding protein H-NS